MPHGCTHLLVMPITAENRPSSASKIMIDNEKLLRVVEVNPRTFFVISQIRFCDITNYFVISQNKICDITK